MNKYTPIKSLAAAITFSLCTTAIADDNYYKETSDRNGLMTEYSYTPQSNYWQGCSEETTELFWVSSTLPDPVTIEFVILRDKNNIPDKWDLRGVPYRFLQKLPAFFNEGNKLRVTYRSCGSSGHSTIVNARIVSRSVLKK